MWTGFTGCAFNLSLIILILLILMTKQRAGGCAMHCH